MCMVPLKKKKKKIDFSFSKEVSENALKFFFPFITFERVTIFVVTVVTNCDTCAG